MVVGKIFSRILIIIEDTLKGFGNVTVGLERHLLQSDWHRLGSERRRIQRC